MQPFQINKTTRLEQISISETALNQPQNNNLEQAIEVSIIMPCLNEAETIVGCVTEARLALQEANVSGEVLVIDNGSTDGSQTMATEAGATVVNERRKGYGNALMSGIKAAQGKYVLMADSDGSYNFRDLPRFLTSLRAGDELVMGCRLPRYGGNIEPNAMPWLHRWIGNPVLSAVGKIFFKAPVNDFHCGIRAFNRASILNLGLRTTGMEFASEMVVKASLAKLKMSEVPVTLRPDGRSRPPHLRSWRDGWRHLRFLLMYSPKWLFLYPGLLLCLLGLIGFTVLMFGPLSVSGVIFDTNTLLVCAVAILVGFQIILSYIFVKAYAVNAGLLPHDRFVERILDGSPVEWGIGAGFLLLVGGFLVLLYALLTWQQVQFGPLSYSGSLRIVIPGVLMIALGTQLIFAGFCLAIVGVKHR